MRLLERYLAGDLPADTQIADAAWQSRGLVDPALLVLLVGLICAAQLYILWRDARTRHAGVFLTLGLLRTTALGLVAFALFAPVLILTLVKSRPPTTAVLVDASRSMTFLDSAEGGGNTRWEKAKESAEQDLLPALREQGSVRLFVLDSGEAGIREVGDLEEVEPVGNGTALGNAFESLNRVRAVDPLERVVLLSDGRNTGGLNPVETVQRLRGDGVTVDAFLVGQEDLRNLRIENLLVEPYAFMGDIVQYEVRVAANGYAGEVFPVILQANGEEQQQVQVQFDETGATARLEFQPEEAGKVQLSFEVPVQDDEAIPDDNVREMEITVLDEKMRVLVIEEQPRWEYRFLHTALQRDPRVEPSFLLSVMDHGRGMPTEGYLVGFPESGEELDKFDLVLVGDIPGDMLDNNQMERLRDYVLEDGGSVVFVPGRRHGAPFAGTPLETLLPIEVDSSRVGEYSAAMPLTRSYQLDATPLGQGHAILSAFRDSESQGDPLADLPGMYWHVPVSDVRPGSMVLARHSWAGEDGDLDPLLVFQYAGRGRSLYHGFDETWRWRFKFGNRFYYQFWGNVIQTMAMPHLLGEKDQVQFDAPHTATAGETVVIGARVITESGSPLQAERQQLEILDVSGKASTMTLFAVPEQPGYFRGEVVFQSGGRHRLSLASHPGEGEATVQVREASVDLRDPDPNPDLMRRIAAVGGGNFAEYEGWAEAARSMEIKPVETRWIEERSIWDRSWVLLAATLLLATEWVLRRVWRLL